MGSISAIGQEIHGVILSATDSIPIPYAHIGIIGTSIGTISDERGRFTLSPVAMNQTDTVRFSALGYAPQEFLVSNLGKENLIKLDQQIVNLEVVQVNDVKGNHKKQLGYKSVSKKIVTGWTKPKSGGQRGILLRFPAKKPVFSEKIRFHIARSSYDSLLFRVHFYQAKDNWPGKSVNQRDIFIKTKQRFGWVESDLTPYNLVLTDNTFVTLEIVEAWSTRKKGTLLISANLLKGAIYHRESSEDHWQKAKGTGASILVDVRY